MLTRFVRIQLTIFTIASIIGLTAMVFVYLQVPTLLGIGHITVKLELPASGGLYQFSNVTYRGVQVGKVTAIHLTDDNAVATLSLDSSPKIPADLQADILSISAVGEQYVDLRPRTGSPPYLHDGSVITMGNTTIPQQVGPMLDQVSALVGSIPKDKLGALLDESFKGFNGAGDDFASLLDSGTTIAANGNSVAEQTRRLMEDAGPLLDSQAQTTDAIRTWAPSLARFTGQLVTNDPQIRTLLKATPGAANEVARLLTQVKPTLPILLANLTSLGQIAVTYHDSVQQLLVLLPPYVAETQGGGSPKNNPTGITQGDFGITISDPPACTVGFLPPSSWRSPADTSEIDTPDGLYCKLPQDSPIAVRGARNYPCMGHPGKRAPTVELCDSDQPFVPLAEHQHAIGPYPIDPNLLSQGIPPDSRVNPDAHIYGPLGGTPPPAPAGNQPAPAPPAPSGADSGAPPAAPSSYGKNSSAPGPSIAVAPYDPRTGQYVTPDGRVFRQGDLVATGTTKSWKDLVFSG